MYLRMSHLRQSLSWHLPSYLKSPILNSTNTSMPIGDPPSPFDQLLHYINRDFQLGYHHFEPVKSDSVARFFNHEVSLYSRRFRMDEKNGVTTLFLDLPGFKSADLSIKLEKGILTVAAKNEENDFDQSINVGRDVDPDKVEATLDLGVLTIKLHKLPSAQARAIPVK